MQAEIHGKTKTLVIILKPDNIDERLKLLNFMQMKTGAVVNWNPETNEPYGQVELTKTLN